jgi:hypothetical protein
MTKEETKTLAVVIERVENIKADTGEIKEHLRTLNGKVAEHALAIEKTREIAAIADGKARSACDQSSEMRQALDDMRKNSNRVYLSITLALLGAMVAHRRHHPERHLVGNAGTRRAPGRTA